MRSHKKWMMVLTCILAVALMAGCGVNKSESQKTETNAESMSETTAASGSDINETTVQSNSTEASGESGTGKILIAYFSGTGNTKAAAEKIAAATNGELFELQPVNNFIKNNDFTGKTVIPFCTSASSGLGDSGNLLEKMAESGNWLEGKRFSSNVSDIEIQEWIDSLNLK